MELSYEEIRVRNALFWLALVNDRDCGKSGVNGSDMRHECKQIQTGAAEQIEHSCPLFRKPVFLPVLAFGRLRG